MEQSGMPPAQHPVAPAESARSAGGSVPPVGPAAQRKWRRNWKLVVAVLGGVVALLCLGGAGVGLVLYDQATKPNRSAPDVAAHNFLTGLFVNRDEIRTSLFVCQDRSGLKPIYDAFAEMEDREAQLQVTFVVNIEDLRVARVGADVATATVNIRRTAVLDGVRQSLADGWHLELRDEDGWRVCSATPAGTR